MRKTEENMEIAELCRALNREMKNSDEFRNFVRAQKKLQEDEDLSRQLTEFRAHYRDIQMYAGGNPYDELLRLTQENDWLIHNSVVSEFLKAENSLSRLVQGVVESLSYGLLPEDEEGKEG
jgi:cell fate (sporulation/competence/biofilm development) regulator YlbF (YheA/YmcA/DUF963 family)